MTTTNAYDPVSALTSYYASRTATRPARLWATEKLLQDLAAVGIIDLFEGPGTNPTVLTGYNKAKLWLQVSDGVTDAPGVVRVYDGAGDETSISNWPILTAETFGAYLTSGQVDYQGAWNAATNTPTLSSGAGTKGWYYVVSTPGSTNLDGTNVWASGDWAIYNGAQWQKVDNTTQNVSSLAEDTANDDETDFLLEYDTSALAHKKVKPKNLGFTQGGSGATRRSLQSKIREFVSVTDYGAVGDNATNCTTAFSNAKTYATANNLAVVVPAGSYRVDETFDWGAANARWWLLPAAIILDLSGNPHQGYASGGYLGDYGVLGVPSDQGVRIISPYGTYLDDADITPPGSSGVHVWSAVRDYDGESDAAYSNIGANIVAFQKYGSQLTGSDRASGSTNALQAGINVYRADNGTSGRTEICPIAGFGHCVSSTAQAGLNIYMDFVVSGPRSVLASDREGFLAGAQFLVSKYAPGNSLDADHDGSYGISIATLPGINPGFSPEDKSGHQTYGLRSGLAIVGWSGPSTATSGTHASATVGYEVGIQIGGLGGSVWNEVTQRSKIGTGIQVTDYINSGIDIFSKHPSATAGTEPALRVYTDAGPTLIGVDSTAATDSILEVGSGSGQFQTGIKLRATTHVTSERAGIGLGDWVVGQDSAGSGARDFFIFGGTSPAFQMTISTAGLVAFNNQRITSVADPSSAQDVATKNYVDTVAAGLDPKASVLCATTANITLSGEQTIDGVTTSASRVLVKNQSTASQNGIYVSAAGSWTRATDMDAWTEVPGAYVFVEQGTVNADTGWVCTSNAGGTIGSTSMAWSQFSGPGTYSAGAGLQLSGTQFSIDSTVATLTGSQTLTNKTLTSPVISGGSIDNATIGGTTPAAGTFTAITTAANAAQFPVALTLNESAHVTSNRVTIQFGNLQFLQDTNGDGTRDFGCWMGSAYGLRINTSLDVTAGRDIRAGGDSGAGASGTIGLTNTSDLTANSTGTGTIRFKGATSRDSVGFIKIYVGTTAYFVPVFSAITG